ncbi:MAG: sulfatase-like hydrolase/transferase [Pseudomonadota bacterium]
MAGRGGRGKVLFITIDQLAARALDGDLAAFVDTPNLDRLASWGTRFANHVTVTVPCGPARASLLTGLYAMNHRAVRNGAPLARHHATIATEARKAGYEPLLFGYSDIAPDPTGMDPDDPDLSVYEGVAPGFREVVEMQLEAGHEWPAYLRALGYDVEAPRGQAVPPAYRAATPEGQAYSPSDPAIYAAEHSDTAYLTDRTLAALDVRRDRNWFAHVTYIRPHPPFVAPAPYNRMVNPADLPAPDLRTPAHPFVDAWFSAPTQTGLHWGFDGNCAGMAPERINELRAVYLGLLAEVDAHLGRLLDWLETTGQRDQTLIIVTSDHGEMLGEKRMWGKQTVFDPAFRVPLIIVDPTAKPGGDTDLPTESVDIAPTILEWIGVPVPQAMDGRSLRPLIAGTTPPDWRDNQFMEVDFAEPTRPTRFQDSLGWTINTGGAAILAEARWKYVHFGGGVPPMLFDLHADPYETVDLAPDPAYADQITRLSRNLIDRMMERRDRRLTGVAIGK